MYGSLRLASGVQSGTGCAINRNSGERRIGISWRLITSGGKGNGRVFAGFVFWFSGVFGLSKSILTTGGGVSGRSRACAWKWVRKDSSHMKVLSSL
jgi:hypothetical protein